jgi:hypothetical protein
MIYLLVGIVIILQVLDTHSSHRVFALGGTEANPIMKLFAGSVWAFIGAKVILVGAGLYWILTHTIDWKSYALLFLMVAAFTWVVIHNYRLVRKIKKIQGS